MNYSAYEMVIFCMKENTMATNFESHECVIFIQSTKIGTHQNKAIHSIQNRQDKEICIVIDLWF